MNVDEEPNTLIQNVVFSNQIVDVILIDFHGLDTNDKKQRTLQMQKACLNRRSGDIIQVENIGNNIYNYS